MKKLIIICVVTAMTSVVYALPSDNFNDNLMDTSLWHLYQMYSNAWLDETSQRLEFLAIEDEPDETDADAFYFSNGWGLLLTNDFSFKINFHHILTPVLTHSQTGVLLGLVKDRNNSIYFEAGRGGPFRTGGFFSYELEPTVYEDTVIRTDEEGTLYISYDATADEIYLSNTGYGETNAWVSIPGSQLRNGLGSDVANIFFGGYSDNLTLNSGDAYLDNFVVDSGTIVPICEYVLAGDLNNDCKVNFSDFAVMAGNWLTNCFDNPSDPACVHK
jgi:hypothetical protein